MGRFAGKTSILLQFVLISLLVFQLGCKRNTPSVTSLGELELSSLPNTTAPQITFLPPTTSSPSNSATLQLSGNWSDDDSLASNDAIQVCVSVTLSDCQIETNFITITYTSTTSSTGTFSYSYNLGADGTYYIQLRAKDSVGNATTTSPYVLDQLIKDTVGPTVTSITSTTPSAGNGGTYHNPTLDRYFYNASDVGQTINIRVTFSENISLDNMLPQPAVSFTNSPGSAAYQSTSTNYIDFSYTIQAGSDTGGNTLSLLILTNHLSVKDSAGNTMAAGNLPAAGLQTNGYPIRIDTIIPTVVDINTPSAAATQVVLGDTIQIQLNGSENLYTPSSAPTLTLSTEETAIFNNTAANIVTFDYTPSKGSFTFSGSPLNGKLGANLSGGNITDAAGNPIDNTSYLSALSSNSLIGKNISINALKVEAFYPGYANWNNYIQYNTAGSVFAQTALACNGSETGYYGEYGGCLHSGEIRKIMIKGISSCAGITATDSVTAFSWSCFDGFGNYIEMRTTNLNSGKGLRDLLDITATPSWKTLQLQIMSGATLIKNTVAAPWWSNPVINIVDVAAPSVTTLATGSIYTTNSTARRQYQFDMQDGSSLVTKTPDASEYNVARNESVGIGTNSCSNLIPEAAGASKRAFICSANRKFLWIEANLRGFYAGQPTMQLHSAIFLKGVKFSRINNTTASKFNTSSVTVETGALVNLYESHSNRIDRLQLFDGIGTGLLLDGANKNIITGFKAAQLKVMNSGAGLMLSRGAQENRIYSARVDAMSTFDNALDAINGALLRNVSLNTLFDLHVSNIEMDVGGLGGSGLLVDQSSSNIISSSLFTNNDNAGINFTAQTSNAERNIFHHITIGTSAWTGINIKTSGDYFTNNLFSSVAIWGSDKAIATEYTFELNVFGPGNRFHNIATSGIVSNSVLIEDGLSGVDSMTFSGFFGRRSATQLCSGATNFTNTNCARGATSAITNATNFYTNLLADDASNPIDSSGTGTYANISGTLGTWDGLMRNWQEFASNFRAWGLNMGASIATAVSDFGMCNSGTCRIWDFRPNSASNIYNTSASGTAASGNTVFSPAANGETCTHEALITSNASNFITKPSGGNYLVNAVELVIGSGGNGNGLCESNEKCSFAPHIGAFQGASAATSSPYCIINDGANGLNAIKIYPVSSLL